MSTDQIRHGTTRQSDNEHDDETNEDNTRMASMMATRMTITKCTVMPSITSDGEEQQICHSSNTLAMSLWHSMAIAMSNLFKANRHVDRMYTKSEES